MTNNDSRDPFEAEVRDAFRRKLDTLDSLIPVQPPRAAATARARVGIGSAARVRAVVTAGPGPARLAAVAAVLALVVGVAGSALLMSQGGPASASSSPSISRPPVVSLSPSPSPSLRAVTLDSSVVTSFGTDELTQAVLGADGAAYLIDSTADVVYRVRLDTGGRVAIARTGLAYGGTGWIRGRPMILGTGGPDVLILDDQNNMSVWKEAPGDNSGRGVLKQASIPDSVTWGLGVRAVRTFVVNAELGLYNLYVVVPTARQVLKYPPAADGSGYPKEAKSKYLAVDQDVSTIDDMYVDGKTFLIDDGQLIRYDRGQVSKGWTGASGYSPATSPYYTLLTADNPLQDEGNLYAYDRANRQVVGMRKIDGAYLTAYRATAGLDDVQAIFLTKAATGAETLYWTSGGKLWSAPLSAGSAAGP